ncbi:uncharacterized protein LOC120270283 [Dioscorea cayenensis subsp. rotundata]|uniref:Uncharacterized protein LOC120270283 n=1 Tax=Dioscorea cayennensis subsp. rotundata TaxID=55577 RepID=A0AB40C2J0_DIOCR|nr:uncharacterized protein LOC120270283 [Dioscorea cayenensis subsp. rotundata]
MARRAPATPQEIAVRIAELRMRGTDLGGNTSRGEESEDLSKVIVPYVSPQDDDSSSRVAEIGTSSQDMPTGVKDRDDLLRWVRESFPGAYVQRIEEDEQEDSTTVPDVEGSGNQQVGGEDATEEEANPAQVEEDANERSIDAPTSTKEEATAILSEILGNIHQNIDVPGDTETCCCTGYNIPCNIRKCEVEVSPRLKRKCTEAAKQGEKTSSSFKKEKKKATQQVKDSDEDRFLDEASKKKFESVEERGIVVERMSDEVAFEKFGLTKLLQERSLYKSITFPKSYSLSLLQEFYSNLLSSDKGITRVYVRGKWIPLTPACLNRFLEFKPEVKGDYVEGLELNEEVMKEISGGRTESWGEETRLPVSILTAKYNVLLRLGIQNWLPAPHNSSIVKELALLLFAIGTGKKFNLGRKGETVTAVKKLKISKKLFSPGKKIDLPVGRVSSSPMREDAEEANLLVEEEYEKLLKEQLEDAERRQRSLSVELFIIARQKQKILSRLEVLKKKKKREVDGHNSGGDKDQET